MTPGDIFDPPDIEGVEVRRLRTDPPADPGLHTEGGKLYAGSREVLKGWESFSGWFWFGVEEYADEPGLWFGLVQGLEEEWGDFYVPEILSLGPTVAWPIRPCDLPHAGRRAR